LGGIYGGWYTPSQAGGVAAAYSIFVTCWVYRSFNLRKVLDALMESAGLMGTLLPIIVLAFGLNEFLALMDVQEKLQQTIVRLHPSPAMFMLWVNVALIVLGALMDSISATLIFAPMLAPVAYHVYGIDPLHFGVVFVVNMEIGYLAPPVATNLFVASAVFKKPFAQVAKAVWPTLGITVAALVAVMYIPSISLALVRMKQGKPAYVSFPWEQPEKNDVSTSATPSLKSLTGKVLDGLED
jgi:C4-dicarboxylate transporter DctM subunit